MTQAERGSDRTGGLARDRRKWVLAILAFSVLIRVGIALYLGDVVDAPLNLTDQRSYHALAVRLVQGYGYSFEVGWYPFTPAGAPTAHWSFLYSLLVAGVYALFGPHPLAMRLLQAVLAGILLPLGCYRLAQRLVPGRARLHLLALVAAAGYSYFALYAATLMTESLFIICVLWSLCAAMDLEARLAASGDRRELRRDGISLGLSLGLATLLRQSILPWVAILFLWLLWRASRSVEAGTRRRLRLRTALPPVLLAGGILLTCILPFTMRNYLVYGRFLLLNSNTGYAMYSAQHPMHGTRFQAYAAAPVPEDLLAAGMNEAELDSELMRRGLAFVLEDPRRYLLLSGSRLLDYFALLPEKSTSALHAVGRFVGFGLYGPFMAYGVVLSLARKELRAGASLALLFMLCYSTLHVFTWSMVRYRLPVDAVAMAFAALAVVDLYARIGRHLSRRRPAETRF